MDFLPYNLHERTEEIISFFLGAILGGISGFILTSFNLPYLSNEDSWFVIVVTSLVGAISSIAIEESKKNKSMQKGNFVRNEAIALITHEMRTGLTSTSWAIQDILDKYNDKMSDEDRKNLEFVVESVHSTITHSVNLLDISVLDIKKLSLALELVGLDKIHAMFNEVAIKYKVGAGKRGIKFTFSIKLDVASGKNAEVDMLRLRIITENLLENAIQFNINENKLIEMDVENDNKNIIIKVRDTGIGIPLADQSKIFNEFFRATNSVAKLSSGSGIGMYLSKQYVVAHHGTIRFESKENEGSTFFVTIPLKTGADVDSFIQKI